MATSNDALIVGQSFGFLEDSLIEPIAAIGIVAFILSFLRFIFGSTLG